MEPLTLEQFRGNAYRVLGLDAGASQEQIDAAARLMRVMSGGQAHDSAAAAPWLGPVERSALAIERAVSVLSDPELRAAERLWWFFTPPENQRVPTGPASPGNAAVQAVSVIETQHDAALLRCCRLMIAGRGIEALPEWRAVADSFHWLARSEDYQRWLLEMEDRGDFEKRASVDEITAAQRDMEQRVRLSIARLGEQALDQKNVDGAAKVIDLLRADYAEDPAALVLLTRMEDLLNALCIECEEDIRAAWKVREIDGLKNACNRALITYEDTLRNLMGQISRGCSGQVDAQHRVWGRVVALLELAANAFDACSDKWSTRRALEKALVVATGTVAEGRIRRRLGEVLSVTRAAPSPTPRRAPAEKSSKAGRFGLVGFVLFAALQLVKLATIGSFAGPAVPSEPPHIQISPQQEEEFRRLLKSDPEHLPRLPNMTMPDFPKRPAVGGPSPLELNLHPATRP